MQPELYTDMARLEAGHFWFRARRAILDACLCRFLPQRTEALVLDAGCGVGANLCFLERFGRVYGVELHSDACRHGAGLQPGRLIQGTLASLPFRDSCFAVVGLLDVLEHIDDQEGVLAEILRVLQPGGSVLVTVPAFDHLWSGHDVVHGHRRRYRAPQLRKTLAVAGLEIAYLSYYNTHLYPLVAAVRLLRRAKAIPTSDMQAPAPWLNAFLYRIFASERLWVGRLSMPFGVSLVAIATKPLR